jgi:hypothetical protein
LSAATIATPPDCSAGALIRPASVASSVCPVVDKPVASTVVRN